MAAGFQAGSAARNHRSFSHFFDLGDSFVYLAWQLDCAVAADACADYCVFMFSDLSKMITMQNLYHDGGFSSVGVSQEIMDMLMGESEA